MKLLPIRPPGTAYCKSFFSAYKDTIRDTIGVQTISPSLFFDTIPGLTSISCPTYINDNRKLLKGY